MAGLPQMKLGWIVLSGPEPLLGQARVRVEMIADTFLSVGAPVQYALGGLLQAAHVIHAQILDRVRENFRWIADRVTGTSVSLLRAEGGWSATLRVARTRSEEEWVTSLLLNQNVLVQPGYFYDFESEGYLVVSLLTPPLSFREGLGRLLRHVG
jgi:aspartate/methionine/tyrosine aminotransferase